MSPQKNPDTAYSSSKQPLRTDTSYQLYNSVGTPLRDRDGNPIDGPTISAISWSASGPGAAYAEVFHDPVYSDSPRARVTSVPPADPLAVEFVAAVNCYDSRTKTESSFTVKYPATVGAPIRIGTTTDAPRLAPGPFISNNITLLIPLSRASAIDYAVDSQISVKGLSSDVSGSPATINTDPENHDCTLGENGLSLSVIASCGTMPPKMLPSNGVPVHSEGTIRVTIPSKALTLKEGSGWYVPDGGLTYDAAVWACNSAISVSIDPDSTPEQVMVTIRIEYAEKSAYTGKIAFTTSETTSPADDKNPIVYNIDENYEREESSQYVLVYHKDDIRLQAGIQYYLWCWFDALDDNGWQRVDSICFTGDGTE